MRATMILFASLIVLFTMAGCQSYDSSATATAEAKTEPAMETSTTASSYADGGNGHGNDAVQTAELACGLCVYKMDGVDSCQTAVKIDDTILTLQASEGVDVPAHLCSDPVAATIEGHVEGKAFIASRIVVSEKAAEEGSM